MSDLEEVVIRIEPCGACSRDPGFGAMHNGCSKCKRVVGMAKDQPVLVKTSEFPLVYEVKK